MENEEPKRRRAHTFDLVTELAASRRLEVRNCSVRLPRFGDTSTFYVEGS